ncbi:MAG: type I glutamate--ammonia ligase [Oligoflexia bacterium]|nr:type I glutamate--ammonia ligase [Oligoflexia bacterium]
MNLEASKNWEKIKKLCHIKKIEMIDLKTQDINGRLHHLTIPAEDFTEEVMNDGIAFNTSSFGFNTAGDYDLVQVPDLDTVFLDSFRDKPTLSFFVDIYTAKKNKKRAVQDSRFIAQKASAYLKKENIADSALFSSEIEFYIFENVKYDARRSSSYYYLESSEKLHASAYHAVNPMDRYDDFRDKATCMMRDFGIRTRYHHHELGKKGQQEIEFLSEPLLVTADHVVTVKYLLFNMADKDNLNLTFMPKPMFNSPGSGWHVHSSLIKDNVNIFYDPDSENSLSSQARWYIGGILKHMRSLCALTNPSTNSYKRLVPGYEAPVAVSYGRNSMLNAIRIPTCVDCDEQAKLEIRTPDMSCNPYLALSAILLAGIDGIKNKIEPKDVSGDSIDNVERLSNLKREVELLPRYLDDALDSLEMDYDYLLQGDVFTPELIDYWIKIKRNEIRSIATRPHPFEFKLYFCF